ncbi:MAG TPA: flavodoxin-dependent (E)-4-hydroxy-3-methylbut-2-enyl-diphosphate synthase [Clostridia bacterium]|nr:flavodoxin-dependent (E)-4-hydroxy-3-methylbut-2-enyl-diphosphate synthase [Clostridia bacterium]
MNNLQHIKRRKTRVVSVGGIFIGGNYPITVQSMTNTDTRKIEDTVKQIKNLEKEGCDLVRVAVPDMSAALALNQIKEQIKIPLIADVHFDYRLALEAIKQGVDGLRINPGNIGSKDKIKMVIEAAQKKNIPIRIGVNAGSLEKRLAKNKKASIAELMVESALNQVEICEEMGFFNLLVSLKASDILTTVEAYRLIAKNTDLPLHLGITEAGTVWAGTIKSAIGIGALLLDGIGDTIRVSLTGDPIEEVRVGKQILKSLGLKNEGINFISCPTCGRCEINLINLAKEAEEALKHIKEPLTIAIMGCAVNGPGEAKGADLGIAGGKGEGLLFKHGQIIKRVAENRLLDALLEEVNLTLEELKSKKAES